MLGVRTAAPKTSPTVSKTKAKTSPTLLPQAVRPDKRVFLPEEMWEALSRAAKFHEEVFKKMERDESVSRNKIIEGFLEWALESYWDDKGGEPPGSGPERERKVAAHAAKLLKEEAEKASSQSTSNNTQSR
jgi:hypothetical protein